MMCTAFDEFCKLVGLLLTGELFQLTSIYLCGGISLGLPFLVMVEQELAYLFYLRSRQSRASTLNRLC